MKKIFNILIGCSLVFVAWSCTLDEYNPASLKADETLTTYEGVKRLTASCYVPLYGQLFSASDFLFICESGTDLWLTPNNKTTSQQLFYYEQLTNNTNQTNKVFKQAYASINTCNAVLMRADGVTDAKKEDLDILRGEAYCLRAFYYLTLTTHYGAITLSLSDSSYELELSPKRNTLQEIYSQIISDLNNAEDLLGVQPLDGNKARVTKKTAKGLKCRAYAQGAGEGLTEDGKSYWERAYEESTNLINNMSAYDAYMFTDFDDVFLPTNNRDNRECLFIASGPRANTDSWSGTTNSNKLLSYCSASPYTCSDFYKQNTTKNGSYLYGRTNSGTFAPSEYLLDCFDPSWDKRWNDSFVTAWSDYTMVQPAWGAYTAKDVKWTETLCAKYGINPKFVGTTIHPAFDLFYTDGGSAGNQYLFKIWPKGDYSGDVTKLIDWNSAKFNPYPLDQDDDRFSIYIHHNDLTAAQAQERPYICINYKDLFDETGKYWTARPDWCKTFVTDDSGNPLPAVDADGQIIYDEEGNVTYQVATTNNLYNMYPTLSKFAFLYDGAIVGSNTQLRAGDMFIMRMAEVYLIAAESSVMAGKGDAAQYLNVLRKRACINESDYAKVALGSVTMDDVYDEYARELCGEFNRWALLKRHRAFEERLPSTNPRAALSFDSAKHYNRPISYDFLNQIDNADEYGDNGYAFDH